MNFLSLYSFGPGFLLRRSHWNLYRRENPVYTLPMEYVLFASALTLFLFACSQLLTTTRQPVHYSMFIACISLSYAFFYIGAVPTGVVGHLPAVLVGSDISATFFAVAGFYLASRTILNGGAAPVRHRLLLYVPPALLAPGLALYNYVADPDIVRNIAQSPGYVDHPALRLLVGAAYLSLVVAIVLNLAAAYQMRSTVDPSHRRAYLTQVAFLSAYLLPAILAVLGVGFGDNRAVTVSAVVFAILAAGFTLTCTSIVYFSQARGSSDGNKSAARPDWDETAEELSERLWSLMESSAPYLAEDLTEPELARMLGEEPKRLAYHFNATLRTNFRGYINALRLEAVCSKLLSDRESSILDVALSSGFNSKSSFNTLFKKKYGVTPREFRAANTSAEECSALRGTTA